MQVQVGCRQVGDVTAGAQQGGGGALHRRAAALPGMQHIADCSGAAVLLVCSRVRATTQVAAGGMLQQQRCSLMTPPRLMEHTQGCTGAAVRVQVCGWCKRCQACSCKHTVQPSLSQQPSTTPTTLPSHLDEGLAAPPL